MEMSAAKGSKYITTWSLCMMENAFKMVEKTTNMMWGFDVSFITYENLETPVQVRLNVKVLLTVFFDCNGPKICCWRAIRCQEQSSTRTWCRLPSLRSNENIDFKIYKILVHFEQGIGLDVFVSVQVFFHSLK